jgi:hypothetical protein
MTHDKNDIDDNDDDDDDDDDDDMTAVRSTTPLLSSLTHPFHHSTYPLDFASVGCRSLLLYTLLSRGPLLF